MKKTSISQGIKATLKEYCKQTSLNGFKILILTKSKHFRIFWSFVLLGLIAFSAYIIIFAANDFTTNPTITTLDSWEYEIWKVPFPAVALCTVNKMSRIAVYEYAKHLQSKSGNNVTQLDDLMEKITFLGSLIFHRPLVEADAESFQYLLDTYETDEKGYFDPKAALFRLAPRCEDLLVKCRWLGVEYKCSELFKIEATREGFCCLFNYVRRKSNSDINKIRHANLTGFNLGLVVLMNASTADYYYNAKNTYGFIVKVFNAISFLDVSTGGLQEYMVTPNEEAYMKLKTHTLTSTSDIRHYTVNQRKCYFPNEIYKDYGNYYSYANCLTKCKLRSMIALCNCVPFYAPLDLLVKNKKTVFCTLNHYACTSRYRLKWNTYKPVDMYVKGLESEMEDALSCPDCLPMCFNTVYNTEVAYSTLMKKETTRLHWGILKDVSNLTDLSLLRIYFSTANSLLYKKDVLFTWYEILGNFGGLLGISLGCSIISIIEIVYFATYRLYKNIRATGRKAKKPMLLVENDFKWMKKR